LVFKITAILDTSIDIAKLLLPEILVDYFKLTKHELKQGALHFYFTELNTIPEEFKDVKLSSKEFFSRDYCSRFSNTR